MLQTGFPPARIAPASITTAFVRVTRPPSRRPHALPSPHARSMVSWRIQQVCRHIASRFQYALWRIVCPGHQGQHHRIAPVRVGPTSMDRRVELEILRASISSRIPVRRFLKFASLAASALLLPPARSGLASLLVPGRAHGLPADCILPRQTAAARSAPTPSKRFCEYYRTFHPACPAGTQVLNSDQPQKPPDKRCCQFPTPLPSVFF